MKNIRTSLFAVLMVLALLCTFFGATGFADAKAHEQHVDLKENDGYVYLSVEAFTLGWGYIVPPTKVPYNEGETLGVITGRIFDSLGIDYGDVDPNSPSFYLGGITCPQLTNGDPINVPDYLLDALIESGCWEGEEDGDGHLGAYDYSLLSGWMCSENGQLTSLGAGEVALVSGNTYRWHYSIYGYGMDCGMGDGFGMFAPLEPNYMAGVDRETAMAYYAEFMARPDAETLLLDNDILEAVNALETALTTMTSTQEDIDEAVNNLSLLLEVPEIMPGDTNLDNELTASDALLILRHALSVSELTGDALLAADFDENGTINSMDALFVLRAALAI